jgi:hypothetical protein
MPITILAAKAANGIGSTADVRDYKNIILTVHTPTSTTLTIKFAVSNSLKAPDFSAAASETNMYDYVQISPINSQLTADKLAGSTGIAISGAQVLKMYEVNSINGSNSIFWLCPIVSGYSAGSATVEITGSSDETH